MGLWKDIIKMKKKNTEGEKIFTSESRLLPEIWKEHLRLNNKNTTQLKNGCRILTDISLKKRWFASIRGKDAKWH